MGSSAAYTSGDKLQRQMRPPSRSVSVTLLDGPLQPLSTPPALPGTMPPALDANSYEIMKATSDFQFY